MFQARWTSKDGFVSDQRDQASESARQVANISRLLAVLRRNAWLFLCFSLAGVTAGIAYVLTAVPLYTASARVMVDHRQLRAVRDFTTLSEGPPFESPEIVGSQAEVLRSDKIGLAVIRSLKLTRDDPAFAPPTWVDRFLADAMSRLEAWIGVGVRKPEADVDSRRQLKVLRKLQQNLVIARVGNTFVLQASYAAPDPTRAAEVVNEYTKAYLSEQLEAGIEATRRAREWLSQRTEELRQSSVDADLAVQKFKADNDLLTTKAGLVSEQQINEMTTQLVAERAAAAQARIRYLRIKAMIDTNQTDSAVTESLANPVVNELRTKYFDASKRMIHLERKLGSSHVTVIDLKNTMEEYKTLLFQELGRIAETYKADYEVAAAREAAMAENLARQQKVAITANNAQVELRQLEQKAESYKILYDGFLRRYQETAQQESFPLPDAHIISPATPPLEPSHPRTTLVIMLSLAFGMVAGGGVAALRELNDRVFRTGEQVRDELGADVIGMLPTVAGSDPASATEATATSIMHYAVDHPFSAFAETLRAAKIAADVALKEQAPKVIGVVSLLPHEGKTTVAKNLASLLAWQGAATLLIDADTRNPVLTRTVGGMTPLAGNAVAAEGSLDALLEQEPTSGLRILRYSPPEDDRLAAVGLSAAPLGTMLRGNGRSYDYVVIDLPPIGPVVNARGLAPAVDAFVLVVEWGKTSRGALRATLSKEHAIADKLLGVILNKVDMRKLASYEHFASDGYYHRHYGAYYDRTNVA